MKIHNLKLSEETQESKDPDVERLELSLGAGVFLRLREMPEGVIMELGSGTKMFRTPRTTPDIDIGECYVISADPREEEIRILRRSVAGMRKYLEEVQSKLGDVLGAIPEERN